MGNVMSGMAGGATLGAGVGLGARKAIGAVGASQGAVGKAARGAMQSSIDAGQAARKVGPMTPQAAKQLSRDKRQVAALGSMAGEGRTGLGTAARQNVAAGAKVRTKGGVPGQAAPVAPSPHNPAVDPSLGKTLDQIRSGR